MELTYATLPAQLQDIVTGTPNACFLVTDIIIKPVTCVSTNILTRICKPHV